MASQNPLSVPGGWNKDTPTVEENNPVDKSAVPRTATAGVVGSSGEIVTEGGSTIGKLKDNDDLKSLEGKAVTASGEVLDTSGDVLAKADIDQEASEYTTDAAENSGKSEKSGGWNVLGKTKGAFSSIGGGFGRSKSQQPEVPQTEDAVKGVSDTKDQVQSQVEDKVGDVTGDNDEAPIQLQDDDKPAETDIPKDAEDAVPKDADDAKDGVEGVKDDVEGVKDDAPDAEGVKDDAPGVEGVKEDAPDVEGVKDDAPDVEGVKDDAQDNVEDVKDDAQDKVEDVKDDAEAAKDGQDVPDVPATDDKLEDGEKLEEQVEEETKLDLSALKGTKVNKAGNLVNDKGDVIGRIVDGDIKKLVGKRADENGQIWNDSGKVVGKAELLPDAEREDLRDFAPFENFPDATVEGDGRVLSDGKQVGVVVEGDPKRLKGSKVDEDGDIVDRRGNVVGKAEAWDEPEPEPEAEPEKVDNSLLAGKRVNKAGNIVDSSGTIYGRLIEGNAAALAGRMCDKEGNVRSEAGDIIGKAELVPEGQREGSKEGPFAELTGSTVTKEGKVVTPSGDVVGRLTQGDPKVLYGRNVDEDGDILDKNGNVIGKAERYEEPEVEKKKGPLAGLKVNKEGNVLDESGNIVAKLVAGEATICAGKEVDDDGDVINSKGQTVGHVAKLEDIPPEPEQESAEDKEAREQAEKDRKLAGQLGGAIEQSLEKIQPILRMITDKVDKAERTPKEELDEEQLVKDVRPLIEEGNKILTETNGMIRGMDPDGRIQRQAKHKSNTKDASPEEHHLAEQLKELTGGVQQTIDNAKRKIDGMPHAKKQLNPLWGLLTEPLGQIIAAVGLLLNGVLGLVGRLLSGLGLGGLLDNLLGGLGLTKVLEGLGLGSVTDSLTGKKK